MQVFWKLDSMEGCSRIRRCLRRNYSGTDHLEAARNNDDQTDDNLGSPSNAHILAISKDIIMYDDDDDEHGGGGEDLEMEASVGEHIGRYEERMSGSLDDAIQLSHVISDPRPLSDQDVVQNSTEAAFKKLDDERIVLEVSSSMVRPLRVVKGTFQVLSSNITLPF